MREHELTVWIWAGILLMGISPLHAALTDTIPAQGNVWHIALADTDGDKKPELIYACYHGEVYCETLAGKERWKYNTGAFVFGLVVRDINSDGRDETLVASSDGTLYVISPTGKLLWKFTSPAPLYGVAVGRLAKSTELQVIIGGIDRNLYLLSSKGKVLARRELRRPPMRIGAGDVDGDGLDEAVAVDYFGQAGVYKGLDLEPVWQKRLSDPSTGPKSFFLTLSLDVADLDQDGKAEILLSSAFHNENRVLCADGAGQVRWVSEPLALKSRSDIHYSMSIAKGAEVSKTSPGREVVVVSACQLIILDKNGKILERGEAPIGFTDIAVGPHTSPPTLYLGSSPNGDDRIYALRLSKGWQDSFAQLKREGAMKRVQENIERLRERVLAYKGKAPEDRGPYLVFVGGGSPRTPEAIQGHIRNGEWYRSQFPYKNLLFARCFNLAEKGPLVTPDGEPWRSDPQAERQLEADELLKLVRFCEENNLPVLYYVGHGCTPFIRLETAQRVLEAAPKTCLGFMVAENTRWDDSLTRFLTHFWVPVMDLCLKHGKKAVMVEKVAWWATVPAHKKWFDLLFQEKYRGVLVPSVEDSNSRSPALNLAGRVGLWMAGVVDTWSARVIADSFCFNRFWEYEYPMCGHPFLRALVAHTALGASFFEPVFSTTTHVGDELQFTPQGRESLEIFLHMLGKGIIIPPRREEMAGLSPVVIEMLEPAEKFAEDVFNCHGDDKFTEDAELHSAVFPHLACFWGMSPTPPESLARHLFGQERQFGTYIPETPFGFPVIIPYLVSKERTPWAQKRCATDGLIVREGASRLSGAKARQRVVATFEEAAKKLPFRLEGHAFLQATRFANSHYRLYLIDPGFLDPADREVTVHIQMDKSPSAIRDLLGDGGIRSGGKSFTLRIPAGAFRIVDVRF